MEGKLNKLINSAERVFVEGNNYEVLILRYRFNASLKVILNSKIIVTLVPLVIFRLSLR